VCGLGIALGFTAGVGRIVSDNHYATDALVGWLVGAASGFLVPSLLQYGFDDKGVGEARTASSAQPIMFTYAGAL